LEETDILGIVELPVETEEKWYDLPKRLNTATNLGTFRRY
jgi:hypothetical protein